MRSVDETVETAVAEDALSEITQDTAVNDPAENNAAADPGVKQTDVENVTESANDTDKETVWENSSDDISEEAPDETNTADKKK